jgi:hypothetical protein
MQTTSSHTHCVGIGVGGLALVIGNRGQCYILCERRCFSGQGDTLPGYEVCIRGILLDTRIPARLGTCRLPVENSVIDLHRLV